MNLKYSKLLKKVKLFVVLAILFPTHVLAEETTTAQPENTQPVTTESAVTEPTTTQPVATEPAATETTTTQPVATEPATTPTTTTQPVATEPATTTTTAPPAPATAPPAAAPQTTSPPPAPIPTSAPPKKSPWFYGANFGASFGDVQYFELSPMIGRNMGKRTSLGVSAMYRYRKDTRFVEDLSTTDYATTVFMRFNLLAKLYLHGEYEYLDYEYVDSINSTKRDSFDSVIAGIGMSSPLSKNSSLYFTALYNFNYDDDNSPYKEPVSLRFGIGWGF